MNDHYTYKSIFAPYINSFIQMKSSLGIGVIMYKSSLLEFDSFFVETDAKEIRITKEQIAAWRGTRVNGSKSTFYNKMNHLQQFCRYLSYLGHECYIPHLPRRYYHGFIPYIFTHKQMKDIFEACDQFTLKVRNMNSGLISLPALFRLLYSTGVRINEALSLKNEDIDFENRQITLNYTKNRTQRLAPINSSLLKVLEQYKQYRDKLPVQGVASPGSYFFVSTLGKHLYSSYIHYWFKKILKRCGIPFIGSGHGPRVHDLRHTCAVHALKKMVDDDVDIYCALPVLSVFIGHSNVNDTERYIRLTQEIYPDIIKMEQSVMSYVFPAKIRMEVDNGND
jgi:integrase